MSQWLITMVGFAAGCLAVGWSAWWVRGSLANVAAGVDRARIDDVGQQLAERSMEVAALQAQHGQAVDRLWAETELAGSFKSLSDKALKSGNHAILDLAKAMLQTFQEGVKGDAGACRQRGNGVF